MKLQDFIQKFNGETFLGIDPEGGIHDLKMIEHEDMHYLLSDNEELNGAYLSKSLMDDYSYSWGLPDQEEMDAVMDVFDEFVPDKPYKPKVLTRI